MGRQRTGRRDRGLRFRSRRRRAGHAPQSHRQDDRRRPDQPRQTARAAEGGQSAGDARGEGQDLFAEVCGWRGRTRSGSAGIGGQKGESMLWGLTGHDNCV